MNYFERSSTLLEIAENYPETIPVFTSNGFSHMGDEAKRKQFGRTVNLGTALMLKQIDYDSFAGLLIDAIETKNHTADDSLSSNTSGGGEESVKVVGLLPCPVRIPLLEGFNSFIKSYKAETGFNIEHELKAASMGLDWVEHNIKEIESASELPDLFISAGFDMFFDEKLIGKFKNQGVFEDKVGCSRLNSTFDGIGLRDPQGHYSIISVVPAVFLINMNELGDLPVPVSWKDILDPVYEKRVSLPVGDFDLFNGILLNIHKMFGDEGIKMLGRNLLESMHPSQMVRSGRKKEGRPVVTIMPNFFTKMVKEGDPMKVVWPDDGAIISPVFMLSKKEKLKKLQPVIDYFASADVGEILSHSGLFPSTNPEVDNRLSEDKRFIWLGWDYIYNHDISSLIKHCESIFERTVKDEESE